MNEWWGNRMGTRYVTGFLPGLIVLVIMSSCQTEGSDSQYMTGDEGPIYEVDPHWPQMLPDNWILGRVAGLSVDSRDFIWIFHRPESLTPEEAGASQNPPLSICCVPAPEVIRFAPDGSVERAWNASGEETGQMETPHGIYLDHEGFVWLGDSGRHQILKFTGDGEFLFRIGEAGRTGGSNHTSQLGGLTDMVVDPEMNELFVADGYRNRRVIVFDAESGEYIRHWGAYGERPSDDPLEPYSPDRVPDAQFRGPVHAILLSNDGRLYVTDRGANRVQVFERNGTFLDEVIIRPETLSMGSTWDIALSEDTDQQWLYVADGTNNRVWILERESLELIGEFGHGGKGAGFFGWLHNIDVDSRGNLFTSEVEEGKRVQRFVRRDGR